MLTYGSAVWSMEPIAVGARQWLVLTHEAEHVVGVEFKRCTCFGGRFEKHFWVVDAHLLEYEVEVVVDVLNIHVGVFRVIGPACAGCPRVGPPRSRDGAPLHESP